MVRIVICMLTIPMILSVRRQFSNILKSRDSLRPSSIASVGLLLHLLFFYLSPEISSYLRFPQFLNPVP